jgi:hypothetical protein
LFLLELDLRPGLIPKRQIPARWTASLVPEKIRPHPNWLEHIIFRHHPISTARSTEKAHIDRRGFVSCRYLAQFSHDFVTLLAHRWNVGALASHSLFMDGGNAGRLIDRSSVGAGPELGHIVI